MKYCPICKRELMDKAIICVGCGNYVGTPPPPVQQTHQQTIPPMYVNPTLDRESTSTANTALLLAFLLPIGGLIAGIVGISKYKTPAYLRRCIAAIVISIIMWILGIISTMLLLFI